MKHLKPEEMVAFRDGTLESSRSLEHLATCEKCRDKVEKLRWLRTLLGKGKGTAVEEHPGRDEIAAFHDEALSSDSVTRIEAHLRSCDPCMGIYSGLRSKSAVSPARLPGPALYRKVKNRFRQTPGPRSLGVLVVQVVRDLSVHFIPAPLKPLMAAESAYMELRASRAVLDAAPAAAERRQYTMDNLETEISGETSDEHLETLRATRIEPSFGNSSELQGSSEPPSPPKPVRVDAGSWRLEISVAGSSNEPRLRITVGELRRQRPATGVLFEMIRGATVVSRTRSDEQGRLELAVPSGDCRLQVGESPPWTIRLLTVS